MCTIVQDELLSSHPFAEDNDDDTVYGAHATDPTSQDHAAHTAAHTANDHAAPAAQKSVCAACTKPFVNGASLARHLHNFPVCQRWIEHAPKRSSSYLVNMKQLCANPRLTGTNLALLLASGGDQISESPSRADANLFRKHGCGACGREFSSPSALNRHYKSSLVCDRIRASTLLHTIAEESKRMTNVQSCFPCESYRPRVVLSTRLHAVPRKG
jgi:hypothetical protein